MDNVKNNSMCVLCTQVPRVKTIVPYNFIAIPDEVMKTLEFENLGAYTQVNNLCSACAQKLSELMQFVTKCLHAETVLQCQTVLLGMLELMQEDMNRNNA